MNSFHISGQLTHDPKLRYSKTDFPIAEIGLVNTDYGSFYFDCMVFGKDAETCHTFLKKGRWVEVSGHFEKENKGDKVLNIVEKIRFSNKKDRSHSNKNERPATDESESDPNFPTDDF